MRSGMTHAVMCGPDAKTLDVPLSFLGDGPYAVSLVRDNLENAAAVGSGQSGAPAVGPEDLSTDWYAWWTVGGWADLTRSVLICAGY